MRLDRLQAARWISLIVGIITVLTGLAMIFAPQWFFDNIGNFPPFNRHYLGDLGVFTLALGVGLVLAFRDAARYRLVIGVAALGNILHVLNHAYDSIQEAAPLSHWLSVDGPIWLVAVALIAAWVWANPQVKRSPRE